MAIEKVPVYCYQCVAGPDLLKVVVKDGVAVGVEPNSEMADVHPAGGTVCGRAYGLVEKLYNPARIRTPMRRTNPLKGRDQDPRWEPITWDEALATLADKLNGIRAAGLVDGAGYPRLAATFGSGGIAPAHLGTFAAFLAAWGPVDQGFGGGQGGTCYHAEHLDGELRHRAITVTADLPRSEFVLSFGEDGDASGGVTGVSRHAEARARGLRWVQFEPYLSVTGAGASEWVPIRPKTDAAVLFAMLHVLLWEQDWRATCDVPFLERMTSSPYLVGPGGGFLRDPATAKPVVWDEGKGRPVPFDNLDGLAPVLDGEYIASGIEIGPDGARRTVSERVKPAFAHLRDHVRSYTPEWAAAISDVPAETIRRLACDYLAHATVGATIAVDGVQYPHRPVAVLLGKTVTNGSGGYECCWARTMLAALVGALEVPGGILGTTVRLDRPAQNRLDSVKGGRDGFMEQPINPTAKGHSREHWPALTRPDVWIVYRANPAISNRDTDRSERELEHFPFVAAFAYTQDETDWYADLLLPEATDLESLQLYRIGGTEYVEQCWEHTGWAIRQPVAAPPFDTRDLTDIATELAARTGLLEPYLHALNRGSATTVPLAGEGYDFSFATLARPTAAEIWDRVCRAATMSLSGGAVEHDLEWFKRHGAFVVPCPAKRPFLHSAMVAQGLRHELPYREHEYQAMPAWKDVPRMGHETATRLGRTPEEFPFWLLTSDTMQDSRGSSVSLPAPADVARPANSHFGVMLNRSAAQRLGIGEGDVIDIESATGRTEGRAILREGVRPDVAVMLQPFGHWATPFARSLAMPNLNQVATMDLELTDATGSGADWLPVAIRKASRPAARRDAAARDGAAVLRWTSPWLAGRCDLRERCAIDEAYVRGL